MNAKAFEDKLKNIKEEVPDRIDMQMIAEANAENDGTVIELDEYKKALEYSGKFVIRIPKELHYKLTKQANENGVSLNQYITYKLSI